MTAPADDPQFAPDARAVPTEFEPWLRTVCFQQPTPEAYDLAKCAWEAACKVTAERLARDDKARLSNLRNLLARDATC